MHGPIPDADGGVVPATDEFGIRGRKTQGMNRLLIVGVDGLDGGNARTPIFDISARVTGQEKIVVS